MLDFRTLSCAAALIACSLMPALAQNRALDVRTGLWEITTQRSTTGMPKMPAMPAIPPSVLEKMPPEQRAQIEAALKARQNADSGKHVSKVCVTAEQLEKGPDFGMPRELNCKRTQDVRTADGWQVREVCRRDGRRQIMDIRYTALNRETIEGTVDIVMRARGHDITMKQTSHGRWLGPDCGDVKPMK